MAPQYVYRSAECAIYALREKLAAKTVTTGGFEDGHATKTPCADLQVTRAFFGKECGDTHKAAVLKGAQVNRKLGVIGRIGDL